MDADLARIYGVATKALNQAVKRNNEKFPSDFMFQLTPQELVDLKSQIVTSSSEGNRSQIVTGSGHVLEILLERSTLSVERFEIRIGFNV